MLAAYVGCIEQPFKHGNVLLLHRRQTLRSIFWNCVVPLVLIFLGTGVVIAQNPVYNFAAKPHKAEVKVLAISSSTHSGVSGNQEIYLAEVRFKGTTLQIAKLVDTYQSTGFAIRRSVLTDRHLLRMTLVRNPDCDSTGESFFLPAGDSNVFDSSAGSALSERASENIPCFMVVHEATRLAK
jgi:hypothetical protein